MPLFAASQAHSTKLQRGALLALLLLFLLVLLRTAWICDDAYISLRSVDNFVEGHGLRWNVAERVQTFTHPLWVLLLSGLYALTRELYLTTILLSVCLSWTAVALMAGALPRSFLAGISALLLLLLSPAFVDFSTGGLENPLSHLLLVLFLWAYGKDGRWRPLLLGLIAGLALTTRLDHLWIYLPALALELHRSRDRRTLGMLALGLSPLIAWTLFSLLYYGFPIPNSAVAKLNSGLARGALLGHPSGETGGEQAGRDRVDADAE
jgi:arabinofuranosyltransferase